MYERRLEGRELSFGHNGTLLENAFVMYDRQTNSLWLHVTGEAFFGPLKGKRLTPMPSTVTTWAAWKRAYPHSLVLGGRRRGGLLGSYDGFKTTRNLGVVVTVLFDGKLYLLDALKEQPVVNDRFNGVNLVIYYSQRSGTATAWNRGLRGEVLTFERSGEKDAHGNRLMRDRETGSLWSWLTGEAVAGSLKGRKLGQAMYNPILNDRFRAFYPDAPVYGAR